MNKALPEFIYVLRAVRTEMLTRGPTANEARILGQHFHYLEELRQRGRLVLAGRTTTNNSETFGIAIFRAESSAAAAELMNGDPAVRKGLMTAELFPFSIALLAGQDPTAGAPDAAAAATESA